MDSNISVSALRKKVVKFRDDRDWLKFHNPKDLSIALSIEAAELQELFLWKDVEAVMQVQRDKRQFERVKEEVADIFIYLLSLSDVLGIDLSKAVVRKLAINARKYPIEKAKGSSTKYDKL